MAHGRQQAYRASGERSGDARGGHRGGGARPCSRAGGGGEAIGDGRTDALANGRTYQIPDLRGHGYILNLNKGGDIRVNFERSGL